jgi:hypothetical protein
MATKTPRHSFFIQYRPEDFPLYLLGLVLAGALIVPALPHPGAQASLVCGLAYLAGFFLVRHGAKFERSVVRVALEGMARYPAVLARNWKAGRAGVIPIAVVFLLALTAEHFLRPALAGTRWLGPFPWQWVVWTAFLIVTAFRVVILIAHLLRASVVSEVLESSAQKKAIAKISIRQHIFQAFVTGMVAHLSLVAPAVLFYRWTNPTILREGLLIAGFFLWRAVARPLEKRNLIERQGRIIYRLFYDNHTLAHRSRFFFAVFHGHHHDAIPSALIGSAGGTGFLENVDRTFTWLDPLNSVVVGQLDWLYSIAFDMVVHQYIPGVFPPAKVTVIGTSHHVTHHFGSALPLGMIYNAYVEARDMNNGYKPDNAVTRWFLSEVERREGIDPELGKKFLSLNDYFASRAPTTSPSTSPTTSPSTSMDAAADPAAATT